MYVRQINGRQVELDPPNMKWVWSDTKEEAGIDGKVVTISSRGQWFIEEDRQEKDNHVGCADALYGFMAWITCRKEVFGPFGSNSDAAGAADFVKEFCESQGWKITSGFPNNLKPYPKEKS